MSMSSRQPNILLITSDQHRADALGSAGHRYVRTPHLDLLAQQGVAFDRAYTDCPICIPSRTTLITGLQAHHNGMPAYAADYRVRRPREAFLGSLITQAGYQTQLVGKTHWHTDVGFRAGFEAVTFLAQLRLSQAAHHGRPGDAHGMGVNEFGPTAADLPPHLQSSRWIVERCLEFLRDDTLVIYASDHGELLGDFGAFGKSSFLEPSWRVPLIVRPPTSWGADPGRRSSALVQLADLLPTLCEAADAATPPDIDGRSLLPVVRDRAEAAPGHLHGQHEDAHVVTDGRFKYLYFADDGSELAFDLVADPGEIHPMSGSDPEVERLRAWFHRHLAAESHPHWGGDAPLNRKLAKPSLQRARAVATPGHPGISWGVHWARSIQHFH